MSIFEISVFGYTVAPSVYGLMYVLGFLFGIWYLKYKTSYSSEIREKIFIYSFLGVILGGRLGYIVFYNFSYYLENVADIVKVWEGGMSFHGGLLGVGAALYILSKREKISFLQLADHIAIIAPVGLFFGRIGNYLNKELLGFSYTGPLTVKTNQGSFFPSPLLEALLEGIVIFVILFFILKKPRFIGQFASIFLILYGVFRTIVELFFRTPDPQIGYYFGFLTQGSILSSIMIIVGGSLYYYLSKKHAK